MPARLHDTVLQGPGTHPVGGRVVVQVGERVASGAAAEARQ